MARSRRPEISPAGPFAVRTSGTGRSGEASSDPCLVLGRVLHDAGHRSGETARDLLRQRIVASCQMEAGAPHTIPAIRSEVRVTPAPARISIGEPVAGFVWCGKRRGGQRQDSSAPGTDRWKPVKDGAQSSRRCPVRRLSFKVALLFGAIPLLACGGPNMAHVAQALWPVRQELSSGTFLVGNGNWPQRNSAGANRNQQSRV
ncbi:hypothetical protein PMI02_01928 [Novosphingobium sp. AP12]|nr:hypothetical protein PMI02_01928 [Novosphingobium sp. AP12]